MGDTFRLMPRGDECLAMRKPERALAPDLPRRLPYPSSPGDRRNPAAR